MSDDELATKLFMWAECVREYAELIAQAIVDGSESVPVQLKPRLSESDGDTYYDLDIS